jgi:hypothetical protein
MRNKIKLWLRRLLIRLAIHSVDAIESRCFFWQTTLRAKLAAATTETSLADGAFRFAKATETQLKPPPDRNPHSARRENFAEWQTRRVSRAGFALSPKPRRRRGMPSAEFNRRLASALEEAFDTEEGAA